MNLFAVAREAGPGWIDGKGTFEQRGVNDHATFMNRRTSIAGSRTIHGRGPSIS